MAFYDRPALQLNKIAHTQILWKLYWICRRMRLQNRSLKLMSGILLCLSLSLSLTHTHIAGRSLRDEECQNWDVSPHWHSQNKICDIPQGLLCQWWRGTSLNIHADQPSSDPIKSWPISLCLQTPTSTLFWLVYFHIIFCLFRNSISLFFLLFPKYLKWLNDFA